MLSFHKLSDFGLKFLICKMRAKFYDLFCFSQFFTESPTDRSLTITPLSLANCVLCDRAVHIVLLATEEEEEENL